MLTVVPLSLSTPFSANVASVCEAGEVWLAAEHEGDEALAEEISQLLYWTQVLMISRGLTLDDVYAKL